MTKGEMTRYNPHVPATKTKGLTDKQKQMLEGKSFTAAHKIALAKVGK